MASHPSSSASSSSSPSSGLTIGIEFEFLVNLAKILSPGDREIVADVIKSGGVLSKVLNVGQQAGSFVRGHLGRAGLGAPVEVSAKLRHHDLPLSAGERLCTSWIVKRDTSVLYIPAST